MYILLTGKMLNCQPTVYSVYSFSLYTLRKLTINQSTGFSVAFYSLLPLKFLVVQTLSLLYVFKTSVEALLLSINIKVIGKQKKWLKMRHLSQNHFHEEVA